MTFILHMSNMVTGREERHCCWVILIWTAAQTMDEYIHSLFNFKWIFQSDSIVTGSESDLFASWSATQHDSWSLVLLKFSFINISFNISFTNISHYSIKSQLHEYQIQLCRATLYYETLKWHDDYLLVWHNPFIGA